MIEEDPDEDRYPRELAGSYANLVRRLPERTSAGTRPRGTGSGGEPDASAAARRGEPLSPRRHLSRPRHRRAETATETSHRGVSSCAPAVVGAARPVPRGAGLPAPYGVRPFPARRAVRGEPDNCPRPQDELRHYLALLRELVRQTPDVPDYERGLGQGLYHLAAAAPRQQQNDEADALWREELMLLERAVREQPKQVECPPRPVLRAGALGDLDRERGIQGRFAPGWPLLPVRPHVGVALHNLVLLSMGPAYLSRVGRRLSPGHARAAARAEDWSAPADGLPDAGRARAISGGRRRAERPLRGHGRRRRGGGGSGARTRRTSRTAASAIC